MNVEKTIIQYLSGKLNIPVYGERPNMSDAPDEFITVEKTGGKTVNHIRTSDLAIQSWSTSRLNASELNEKVIEAMEYAAELSVISHCRCENNYNYTDLTTKRPRYQALFEVVHD